MTNTSENYLLFIEPKFNVCELPVKDELTAKIRNLLKTAKPASGYYKGVHVCKCGKRSLNYDLKTGKFITNSLAEHYMCYHRSEVPQSEIDKLRSI